MKATHMISRALLAIGAMLTILILEELALRGYQAYVARQPALIRLDHLTGWSHIPRLSATRINSSGRVWHIETDELGHRILAQRNAERPKLLILGDSFAFGEGVDIEDRFDSKMIGWGLPWHVINTGVMGFGTDQEYAVLTQWRKMLRAGDMVLLLFYQNDFYDVLRTRSSLRAKPYLVWSPEGALIRPPDIGWMDHAREWFYLAALVGRALEPWTMGSIDIERSVMTIRSIIAKLKQELPAGVELSLAFHGAHDDFGVVIEQSGQSFCDLVDVCINLDKVLEGDRSNYLADRHWSANGHASVARLLLSRLSAPR